MHMVQRVLVVGGGIAGLTAGVNLAQRGYPVTLIEREPSPGGNASTVCCKAVAGVCQLCGGCLLADAIDAAGHQANLDLRTRTALGSVARAGGGLQATLTSPQGSASSSYAALVLATGFDHVDARTKGPYGYGLLPAVISGEEMERRLAVKGQGAFDGRGLQRVAFIQCVGSRDEHSGRGYCSQVCCRYALRLARLLKARVPTLEITVFKMDIQTSGRDFRTTWEAVTSEGIRIVAGLPAVVRRSAEHPARAQFLYENVLAGQIDHEEFDLVVLSTGMQPRRDAEEVAAQVGINRDRFGFFATADDGVSTLSEGVFVAGACGAPRSIAESAAHAAVAAAACDRYLREKGA